MISISILVLHYNTILNIAYFVIIDFINWKHKYEQNYSDKLIV